MKRFVIALLCAVAVVSISYASTDYLWLYSSWFSSSAVNAALKVEPIINLNADADAIYRLGFAAGYDTAKNEDDITSLPDDGKILRTSLNTDQENVETYIINTETNKFHIPGCSSEKAILPEHRKEVHGTIEEVRQMGYSPCGRCLKGK